MGLLSGFLDAIAALFGYAKQRDKEMNTPAMQANAEAATEQKTEDKIVNDITTGDLDHIREDAS